MYSITFYTAIIIQQYIDKNNAILKKKNSMIILKIQEIDFQKMVKKVCVTLRIDFKNPHLIKLCDNWSFSIEWKNR